MGHDDAAPVAGRRSYFGNCIWDALGVAAMLGEDVEIPAACGDCGIYGCGMTDVRVSRARDLART